MKDYQSYKSVTLFTFFFFVSILYTSQVFSQTIFNNPPPPASPPTPGSNQITVKPGQNGTDDGVFLNPFNVTLNFSYINGESITVSAYRKIDDFAPEIIESVILVNVFTGDHIELSKNETFTIDNHDPIVIDLTNYQLRTAIYSLVLMNNNDPNQRISYHFKYF